MISGCVVVQLPVFVTTPAMSARVVGMFLYGGHAVSAFARLVWCACEINGWHVWCGGGHEFGYFVNFFWVCCVQSSFTVPRLFS